jgi:hypothetical protein
VRVPRMSVDEARLRPHLRAVRQAAVFEAEFERAVRDGVDVSAPASNGRGFKPEPGDLRGVPIVGPGVGGVVAGTQPEAALLARERRRTSR